MDKTRKKIDKKVDCLNNTINHADLADICRTLHTTIEYKFFSSAHGTFSRLGHMIGHKESLSKFKRTDKIQYIYPIIDGYLGTHEHVEIKQHAPKKKKSMNQRRNHTQKIRIYFDERK